MSDDFERELRDQLEREARQASRFPDPLRTRILDAIEPRRRLGLTQQLALAGALLVFVALLAVGVAQLRGFKGGPLPAATPSATVAPSAAPSAAPSVQPSASALSFICGAGSGGAGNAQLTDVRIAHHQGYDRITFQFNGPVTYSLATQANTHYVTDPKGENVYLQGSAGLLVRFDGSSDYSPNTGQPTYNGSSDLTPNLPSVKEVRRIADFEGVFNWAVGISGSPCYRVTTLTGPDRLVIDIQAP